jgi:hypothetical protein
MIADMILKVSTTLKVPDNSIYIFKVEKDHADGILVTFSDGTSAGYVVEELLSLRPIRERVRDSHSPPPLEP